MNRIEPGTAPAVLLAALAARAGEVLSYKDLQKATGFAYQKVVNTIQSLGWRGLVVKVEAGRVRAATAVEVEEHEAERRARIERLRVDLPAIIPAPAPPSAPTAAPPPEWPVATVSGDGDGDIPAGVDISIDLRIWFKLSPQMAARLADAARRMNETPRELIERHAVTAAEDWEGQLFAELLIEDGIGFIEQAVVECAEEHRELAPGSSCVFCGENWKPIQEGPPLPPSTLRRDVARLFRVRQAEREVGGDEEMKPALRVAPPPDPAPARAALLGVLEARGVALAAAEVVEKPAKEPRPPFSRKRRQFAPYLDKIREASAQVGVRPVTIDQAVKERAEPTKTRRREDPTPPPAKRHAGNVRIF
jgi:hypothetical protein